VTATEGPSPTATQIIHVVEEGENLFSIAEIYQANVCTMMAVNNIVDASFLSVGQSLIIPPADFELPTSTPFPTDVPRATVVQYVVQCGDTLDSIAALFNSTGVDVGEQNDIADDTELQIGMVIEVRVNLATPTATATYTVTPAQTAAATETPTP
jgi:spore germination protein